MPLPYPAGLKAVLDRERPYYPSIKRKLSYRTDAAIRQCWETLPLIVPQWWADYLITATALEVEKVLQRYTRPLVSFSTGKESLALIPILERVGVTKAFYSMSHLGFKCHARWFEAHRRKVPYEIEQSYNYMNHTWLKANPQMIFSRDSALRGWLGQEMARRPTKRYARRHGYDIVFYGNRRNDGNRPWQTPGDLMVYSPMADWTTEDVLAVCYYKWGRDAMPPCYAMLDGWLEGPKPWILRGHRSWAQLIHDDLETAEYIAQDFPPMAQALRAHWGT